MFRRWAGDRETRSDVALRHMGYFNTNPILAPFIVGVVVNFEERRLGGEAITDKQIGTVKDTLSSVSTTVGDIFFDVVLVPLGLTIGSIFAIYGSYIGLAIFLALYNFYHFRERISGYRIGLRLGGEVGRKLVTRIFREQNLLGGCAAFASGVFAALVFSRAYRMGGVRYGLWGIGAVAAVVLLRRRFSYFWCAVIVFLAASLYLLLL
jgi:mannose/fructose/N-acetylgalactosamine-specific phosphotransferase system component IID